MKITLIRKDETLIVQRTVKLETVLENMKTETKTSPVTALRRALKFAGGSGHIMAVDKQATSDLLFGRDGQKGRSFGDESLSWVDTLECEGIGRI